MKEKIKQILFSVVLVIVLSGSILFIKQDSVEASSSPDYVVVLDAGHDSSHAGAGSNGFREEYLCLRIAQYCKQELEQYNGVKVYMVRNGEGCPYGGMSIGNNVACNALRVQYAKSVDADLYISFHLNSGGSKYRGVSVYYPNSSYKPMIGYNGRKVASEIINQLKALGIPQQGSGLYIRNSEDGTKYPDGSIADYLAVIKGNKYNDIPAALIEHCYISNATDRQYFLSSDTSLRNLGVADATGIANYLGVSKTTSLVKSEDGNIYYYKNGKVDTSYTGLAQNKDGWWYVKSGKVDFSYTGLAQRGDNWYYIENGKFNNQYNGILRNQYGDWLVGSGVVNFGYTGLYNCNNSQVYNGEEITFEGLKYFRNGKYTTSVNDVAKAPDGNWYYVANGTVDYTVNTVAKNSKGWWYIRNGKVDFSYNGIARNENGDWLISKGQVQFGRNGFTNISRCKSYYGNNDQTGTEYAGWYYLSNGKVLTGSETVLSNGRDWYYIGVDGRADFNKNTVAQNQNGWWVIRNGQVNFGYNGLASNQNGTWYCNGGKVNFGVNGVLYTSQGWYYISGGKVQTGTETVQQNQNGWWYIGTDGKVDFSKNTVAQNQYGWWVIRNGQVNFNYNGIAENQNGIWYCTGSKVQFGANGVLYTPQGWYYIRGGKVQTGTETVEQNSNGWWYIGTDGKVNFNFNGLASNRYGTWYLQNGKVSFIYNNASYVDPVTGNTYRIVNSKAELIKVKEPEVPIEPEQPEQTDEDVEPTDMDGINDNASPSDL